MWEEKKDYREFYTPPPIRNEVTRNARFHALAGGKSRSSMLVLNSHKIKVARLLTYSKLLQSKIKSTLKVLKHCDHNYKIQTMFNCSDSGYGSGLGDIVTASGLENPDHVGWIMDLSCSELRWCVVADMLFCVFENDFAENPLNVLVLPGFEVKNLVYNSAKRSVISDAEQLGERNKIDTKTVSGMLKYQFVLQNNATGKNYAFGMDNKTDLEIWMSVLRCAISLEADLFEDSDSDYEEESVISETSSELSINKKGSIVSDSIDSGSTGQKAGYKTYSRTSSGVSDYSFWSNGQDGKSSITSASGINTFGRSQSSQNLMSKSCDEFDPPSYMPSPRVTQSRKERFNPDLLTDTSNSKTCLHDELGGDYAFKKVTKSRSFLESTNENVSDSEVTKKSKGSKALRKLSSVDDFRRKLRINAKTKNDNGKEKLFHKVQSCDSLDIPKDITDWVVIESSEMVESGNNNGPCGKETSYPSEKLKKSNSFKEFFSGKPKEVTILGSLFNPDVQGYLNHKHLLKWTKYWCVIHEETFYAFKSEEIDSVAEFTLQLKDCSLRLVHSDKGKRIYTFKILGQNGKSLYFSADTLNDYCEWLELLKQKTNTTDLFTTKEKGYNKHQESKKPLKFSKSQDDSGPRKKRVPFSRGLSSTSVLSAESTCSSVSMDSSKSTNSLTELLKNYKNLHNGHNNNKGQQKQSQKKHSYAGFPTSVSHSNMPETNTHINENVLQRLRAQRKYSVPNISYSDIMEHLSESKKKSSKSQPTASASQLSKLLSSSKSKLAQKHISEQTQNTKNDQANPYVVCTQEKMISESDRSTDKENGKKTAINQNADSNDIKRSEDSMSNTQVSASQYLPQKSAGNKSTLVSSSSLGNLKECISSLPDKPNSCIFNKHLPGPNNEGLLLVRDDMDSVEKEKPILQHHRSYSDGNLNVIEATHVEDNTTSLTSAVPKSHREAVVINVPAREINSAIIQGYLDRKMEGEDDWVNIWGVLKEDTLFIYQSPIDECSVDSLNVTEWEVQQTDKLKDKHNVLVFKHEEFETQYYSSDSQSDFEHWKEDFHKRAKRSRSSRQLVETKTLEETMLEDLDQQKNELLKYVLSQRKQALKSIQSRRCFLGDSSSQDTDISGSDVTDTHGEDFIMVDDEQNWKDMTQLMQRKVSMQLKLDTIQKSLQLKNKKRAGTKKRFKLPFNKTYKATEDSQTDIKHQENLSRQVKDLSSRLSYLQLDINDKKQQMRSPSELPSEIQDFKKTATFEDKPSKFKLSKKFNVSKIKNSFSAADVKMRSSNSVKNKDLSSMSLRHSWSPDMWRSNMKDRDLSPTSPDSSTSSSSPDHKMSRLALYSRRSPPRVGYLSSIKDLESPQEESEELNMSISSSNISQDTSYESSAMKYDSNSSFMDTPMKDIVYRNNNQYRMNDNEQCKTCDASNDKVSIDLEIDQLNGNTKQSGHVNPETTAKIQEFEDFLKTRLGSG